jgi:Lon protease-like protein
MPMFPLGSVLFPNMPLPLRVFEERYLIMLSELVKSDDPRFGVVLIERGFEVGGGEHRFDVGTAAVITQLQASDGIVGLVAQGGQRFEVVEWLPDEPYPRAEVRLLEDLTWDEQLDPLLESTERLVRRSISQASEFSELVWPADVQLADEPDEAVWQLAAISPLGPLDQVTLLRARTAEELLTRLVTLTEEAAVVWQTAWPEDAPDL